MLPLAVGEALHPEMDGAHHKALELGLVGVTAELGGVPAVAPECRRIRRSLRPTELSPSHHNHFISVGI